MVRADIFNRFFGSFCFLKGRDNFKFFFGGIQIRACGARTNSSFKSEIEKGATPRGEAPWLPLVVEWGNKLEFAANDAANLENTD